jgi:lipid-binding SYLF domain-containing protein
MKPTVRFPFIIFALIACPSLICGKAGGTEKFSDAIRRSQNSAKIISQIAELTTGGIPKDVIDKAQAVVVFPNVTTLKLLMEKGIKGSGVASARQGASWTLPAYYNFGGLVEFELTSLGQESTNIILLFMDKDAVSWFQKGVINFSGEKTPLAGPLEPATDEQKMRAVYTHIIAYTFAKDKLLGKTLEVDFNKGFAIGPNNHINQPLYHLKGPEVLAGKKIDPALLPNGISAFQEALQKYWPAR